MIEPDFFAAKPSAYRRSQTLNFRRSQIMSEISNDKTPTISNLATDITQSSRYFSDLIETPVAIVETNLNINKIRKGRPPEYYGIKKRRITAFIFNFRFLMLHLIH